MENLSGNTTTNKLSNLPISSLYYNSEELDKDDKVEVIIKPEERVIVAIDDLLGDVKNLPNGKELKTMINESFKDFKVK